MILLWQAQQKRTTLQNTKTSLGQCSSLTEAVGSPQCCFGSISVTIAPWIQKLSTVSFKRLHSSTILPDGSMMEAALLQSPVPAFPLSAWRETDRHCTAECLCFQTGSPEPPFSVLDWSYSYWTLKILKLLFYPIVFLPSFYLSSLLLKGSWFLLKALCALVMQKQKTKNKKKA